MPSPPRLHSPVESLPTQGRTVQPAAAGGHRHRFRLLKTNQIPLKTARPRRLSSQPPLPQLLAAPGFPGMPG